MDLHRVSITIILFLIPVVASPATVKVPGDHPTIQGAIDAAGNGDTIFIADGIYSGTGNIDIQWDATTKHLVILSEHGRDHCIIDCRQEGRGFLLNLGQDNRDVIEGLTIVNGLVFGAGGAICIAATSPTVRNCMLINNIARGYPDNSYSGGGGAIMVYGEASPIIQGNIIRNNFSSTNGGGILFEQAAQGVVNSNVIDGNECHQLYGGGVCIVNFSKALIINNLIVNNHCDGSSGGKGGGIFVSHSSSEIINNTIVFNRTGNDYEYGYGGGIAVTKWEPYPIIRNCIIWYNVSSLNNKNVYFEPLAWLDISYCNVEEDLGHIFDLKPYTNIDTLPGFVDPENGNFKLRGNSPCVNRGDPDTTGLYLPSTDLSGSERIIDGTVDMGAYEYSHVTGIPVRANKGFSHFHLYPNPSSGRLFIECQADTKYDNLVLRVINVNGEIIKTEFIKTVRSVNHIDIDDLIDGIYLIVLISNEQVIFRQNVIKGR